MKKNQTKLLKHKIFLPITSADTRSAYHKMPRKRIAVLAFFTSLPSSFHCICCSIKWYLKHLLLLLFNCVGENLRSIPCVTTSGFWYGANVQSSNCLSIIFSISPPGILTSFFCTLLVEFKEQYLTRAFRFPFPTFKLYFCMLVVG